MTPDLYASPVPGTLNAAKNPVYWKLNSGNSECQYIIFQPVLDGEVFPAVMYDKRPDGTFLVDIQKQIMARFAAKAATTAFPWFVPDPAMPVEHDVTTSLLVSLSGKGYEVRYVSGHIENDYQPSEGPQVVGYDSGEGAGGPMYAIRAARQHKQLLSLSDYYQPTNNLFLTNMPQKFPLIPGQPYYLYIYISSDIVANKSIVVTRNDGTMQSYAHVSAFSRGLWCFPISTDAINGISGNTLIFDKDNPHGVRSFTFSLGSGMSIYSEIRSYVIDYSEYPFKQPVLWLNPYGVYESYVFTGYTLTDGQQSSLVRRTRSLEPDFSQPGYKPIDIKFSPVKDLRSDYLSSVMVNWLWEVRKAMEFFLLESTDQGNKWIPYTITDGNHLRDEHFLNLKTVDIKVVPAHQEVV